MLKGIDRRLSADVLHCLRAMGHGDMLILADSNYPALATAKDTVLGRPLSMDNLSVADAAEAILSVMPLDTFVDDFAARMAVVDAPEEIPPVQEEVQRVIDKAEGTHRPMPSVDRFAFYDLARQAFAIIQTGEPRLYGCFMLRKGVIPPEEA
ncbi:MAG: RbsD/FucU domain-containing protein [Pseudomonadota bacterium]